MEILKSGYLLPLVTSLAGLATPASPGAAGLIPAGLCCRGALCSAGGSRRTEMSICVHVCVWCGVRGSLCTWVRLGCVCVRGWVSLVFTESLASAKEENVGIHQVLDQTLLELNNL